MKKTLLRFFTALSMTAAVLACDSGKEDGDGGGGGGDIDDNFPQNTVRIGTTDYSITAVGEEYYGDYYENGKINICLDVDFARTGESGNIFLDMIVPSGQNLVSHEYTLNMNGYEEDNSLAFPDYTYFAYVEIGEAKNYIITAGKVKVSISGTQYTVTANCTLKNEQNQTVSMKLSYKGTVTWSDESDNGEGPEPNVPSNVLLYDGNEYNITSVADIGPSSWFSFDDENYRKTIIRVWTQDGPTVDLMLKLHNGVPAAENSSVGYQVAHYDAIEEPEPNLLNFAYLYLSFEDAEDAIGVEHGDFTVWYEGVNESDLVVYDIIGSFYNYTEEKSFVIEYRGVVYETDNGPTINKKIGKGGRK